MTLTQVSNFLSLVLRHKPEWIGITLDEHGWADVGELVKGISKETPFDETILEAIVRTDKKKRYQFNEDHTKIRACQGHSIPVDLELTPVMPPEFLWHGTGEKYVPSIETTGLQPKKPAVCPSVAGQRNSGRRGKTAWSAGHLPGPGREDAPGRLFLLPGCQWCLADQVRTQNLSLWDYILRKIFKIK